MICFNHETDAVGLCKNCYKALCKSCAIDTGAGIACSEACEKEVGALAEITDKSKQIYGIGSKSKLLPTGILMHFFFALVFIGYGVYQMMYVNRPSYLLFIMGIGFLMVGIMAWYRNRKLNLNC